MTALEKIRRCIANRDYVLSSHVEDEMYADDLERTDVEHALLHGIINRKFTRDWRGVRYRVAGPALNGAPICVICRFLDSGSLMIITVYAKD